MRRGDIYLVDFEPSQGPEANKVRPAVIVSNEGTNRTVARHEWGVVNVVPLTSNVAKVRPFQVFLPADESGLRHDCKAQVEQVRAASFGRLLERLGQVPGPRMREIDEALRRQLVL